MNFSGKNLVKLKWIVELAISDLQMQIGSCPDVIEYSDELDELEADRDDLRKLLTRIERSIDSSEQTAR